MVDEHAPLTAPEIREYYAQAVRESGQGQMNYLSFYEWLKARGLKPKGAWRKEHHRSIYNAVTKRSDFVKVAPGVFALAEEQRAGDG